VSLAPESNPFVLAITDGLLLRRELPAHGTSRVTGRGLVEIDLGQKFPELGQLFLRSRCWGSTLLGASRVDV